MGQCYSVNCKLKFRDKEKVRVATTKYMNSVECQWHMTDVEISNLSLEDAIKQFMYQDTVNNKVYKNGNIEISFYSDFNQRYSWDSLITDWFNSISDTLCNGSFLTVYPDYDYTRLVIKNNECVQTH